MKSMVRLLPLAALSAAVFLSIAPGGARAADIIDNWSTVTAPAAPALQDVTVDPKTTALLMLDFLKQNCAPSPDCMASVPKVQPLLEAARAKKMMVVYTKFAIPGPKPAEIIPELASAKHEPVLTAELDKFLNTNLDQLLKRNHIKTVIVVGSASNGAVMFTAVSAFFHGYDVVVPVDGMSARSPYANQSTVVTLATGPVMAGKIKLTRANMVKF